MRAVPLSLKRAIGVGIGLFILFIGFVDGGIIVKPPGGAADPVPVDVRLPDRSQLTSSSGSGSSSRSCCGLARFRPRC